MTKADINDFSQRLLALKRRLGGDLTQLEEETLRPVGGESSGLSDVPLHPADIGTDNFDVELNLDLLENDAQLLVEVEDALARIEQGTFGFCENCHQAIPRRRLEALPYTRYCIRCAKLLQGEASR
jgi:DnaK suppressor protein